MRSRSPRAYGKIANGEKMYLSESDAMISPSVLPSLNDHTKRGMTFPTTRFMTMTSVNPVAEVLKLKVKRYANMVPAIP